MPTKLAVGIGALSVLAAGAAALVYVPEKWAGSGAVAASPAPFVPAWDGGRIAQLRGLVARVADDALPVLDTASLDAAQASGDQPAIDRAAQDIALKLARMHLNGCASPAERAEWHIDGRADLAGLDAKLAQAVAENRLEAFLAGLRPTHGDYALLRSAYAAEADPARKATLARNMERWRWMPQSLGSEYLLVNAAAFEVGLWNGGQRAATWPVVVGKVASPTPVFAASVSGVIFNPWWDIPANIVAESVGAMVRRNPALAARRGYVWGSGRYRQRPGPGNALGAMKLVMPNGYNVYLHDTPSKSLFAREVRAFSHGCVRVGDAVAFAARLLDGAATREGVDAIVASGKTKQVALPHPLPIYIAYFTATADPAGKLIFLPDIYGRDAVPGKTDPPRRQCAA